MSSPSSLNRRRLALAGAALATFGLAACGSEKSAPIAVNAAAAANAGPVTLQEIAMRASGFSVGNDQERPVYVFFDPQCGFCAKLWEHLRVLREAGHFKWIPVAILNRASGTQGAALLNAADPIALMEEHEASMSRKGGGISAPGSFSEELRQKLETNTQLFQRLKADGVPFMIGRHLETGETRTLGGAVPALLVAQTYGLPFSL